MIKRNIFKNKLENLKVIIIKFKEISFILKFSFLNLNFLFLINSLIYF